MPNVVERIEEFNQGRNSYRRNIKYNMMRESPFAFMRATCHLFFEDWPQPSALNDAPAAWIAGDLHPQNFAVYRGDDQQIYLDINDFDESLLAPCVWDAARLLTSLHIAYAKVPATARKQIAKQCLAAYVAALSTGHVRSVQPATVPRALHSWMIKRAGRDPEKLLNKYSVKSKKKRKLKTLKDETYALTDDEQQRAIKLLNRWSASRPNAKRYKLVDVIGHIGGISSIGLERYLLLVKGAPDNYLLLEIKQRIDSALMPYVTIKQPDWPNAAVRVVTLQQRLQAIPPITPLEVVTNRSASYTLRELEPVQDKIPYDSFKEMPAIQELAETLGSLTAWAHLRSSRRQGSASVDDLIALAAQSAWQTDILKYAADYAKQITSDYNTFCKSSLGTNG